MGDSIHAVKVKISVRCCLLWQRKIDTGRAYLKHSVLFTEHNLALKRFCLSKHLRIYRFWTIIPSWGQRLFVDSRIVEIRHQRGRFDEIIPFDADVFTPTIAEFKDNVVALFLITDNHHRVTAATMIDKQ